MAQNSKGIHTKRAVGQQKYLHIVEDIATWKK